jgi:hypothetical protein
MWLPVLLTGRKWKQLHPSLVEVCHLLSCAFSYGLIAHAEGPFTLGLHGLDASLTDMLANSSRTVLVDADDSADRGEMFSPFRLSPRA